MPKSIDNFDDIVCALANALQEADYYYHYGREKFVVVDNDNEDKTVVMENDGEIYTIVLKNEDNTVDWKIESDNVIGYNEIAIIPDTSETCLEYQLDNRSLEEIAELMETTVNDLWRVTEAEEEEGDDSQIRFKLLHREELSDYLNKFIINIGGTIKDFEDYYKEAENLLISAGYTR